MWGSDLSNVSTADICTTAQDPFLQKNRDIVQSVLKKALSQPDMQTLMHIVECVVPSEDWTVDFSALSPMQKWTLRGLLDDQELLNKINIALQEQFKNMEGKYAFADIKTHIESMRKWESLFKNLDGEVDITILIRKMLWEDEKQSEISSVDNPYYQSFLATQQEMSENNRLSDADMEAIKDIPYKREINSAGIVIHTFGDLAPVAIPDYDKIDLRYSDMDDKDWKRALEHLAESKKFQPWNKNLWASKITFERGAFERMRDHFFAIATLVARKLGINDTIDVQFFDNSDNKSKYERIVRALRIITGQAFVMPYKIDSTTGKVSSLDCNHYNVWVYRGSSIGSNIFAPVLKIGSSL